MFFYFLVHVKYVFCMQICDTGLFLPWWVMSWRFLPAFWMHKSLYFPVILVSKNVNAIKTVNLFLKNIKNIRSSQLFKWNVKVYLLLIVLLRNTTFRKVTLTFFTIFPEIFSIDSSSFPVIVDVPQGRVLSPLIYPLYSSDIP